MPNTTSRQYNSSYARREYSTTELLRDPQKRATYYEMLEYFYNFLDVCQDENLRSYLLEVLERNSYSEMLNAYDRLLETYEKLHPFEDLSFHSKSQFNSLIGITLIAFIMGIIWFTLNYFNEQNQTYSAFLDSKPVVSDSVGNPNTIGLVYYPDFQGNFEGTIGKTLKIKMFLRAKNGKIYGFYFYTKFRRNIRLEGRIDINGDIIMDGSTREEGHVDIFRGRVADNKNIIFGTWIKADNPERRMHFRVEKL